MQPPADSPIGPTHVTVPPELEGARLDAALARLVPGWSRTRLKPLIAGGTVRVDGRTCATPNAPVHAGARIELELPDAPYATTPGGDKIRELAVIHEDEHVVVIDKPAGLLSHANAPHQEKSVAELAEERFGTLPRDPRDDRSGSRPGVVHRLDRLTSGVMVLARTDAALAHLQQQFRERTVDKSYLTLVHGDPRFDSEWLEDPIARDEHRPDRYRTVPAGVSPSANRGAGVAREASTYFEVRERMRGFALIECFPKTGRTHQIRVHMAAAGLPIVGDRTYGKGSSRFPIPRSVPKIGRQLLHARSLAFDHPGSGERVRFEAPVPEDFARFVDELRAATSES